MISPSLFSWDITEDSGHSHLSEFSILLVGLHPGMFGLLFIYSHLLKAWFIDKKSEDDYNS